MSSNESNDSIPPSFVSPAVRSPSCLTKSAVIAVSVWILLSTASLTAALPRATRRGFISAEFSPEVLQRNFTLASLQQLANVGANWVTVEPLLTQPTLNSSFVQLSPDESTTDESLTVFIKTARSLGLNVMIKILLTIDDGSSWVYVSPQNATAWFASYTSFLLHYARLGAPLGVSTLCLGTELAHLSVHAEYLPYWTAMIASIRAAVPGLELTVRRLHRRD